MPKDFLLKVKFFFFQDRILYVLGNLSPGPYPPHFTITYTCGVTIAPKVYGGLKS